MKCVHALVMGGCTNTVRWLNTHPLIIADSFNPDCPDYYDMIVFTGGSDIHPKYYGQKPKHCNSFDDMRDTIEFSMMWNTRHTHYHFGICRGMQLLSVFNGDKLWQDVTGHELYHEHMLKGKCGEYRNKKVMGVTSSHHQAVKPKSMNNVLATTDLGSCVRVRDEKNEQKIRDIVEAVWYEDTLSFGVQGHPEYSNASEEFQEYVFYHLLEDDKTSIFTHLDT